MLFCILLLLCCSVYCCFCFCVVQCTVSFVLFCVLLVLCCSVYCCISFVFFCVLLLLCCSVYCWFCVFCILLYRASVPEQYSYTSTLHMGRTVCTEPQCLYSTAIPLLSLRTIRPVQNLSACTVQLYLYSPYGPYGLYRA